MSKCKLSICIPVYNSADFLSATLDSIIPQLGDSTEIIIYDGGSTDQTATLVQKYLDLCPSLNYFSSPVRGGIDADMAKVVSYANGEYVWLFSGDDVMRQNAINRVLTWIVGDCDVYLSEHTICDRDMNIRFFHPTFTPNHLIECELSDPIRRKEWFLKAQTTEAFFSFISSIIVKKEKWDEGRLIGEYDGSCWAHIARFFDLASNGLSVCYVPEVLLDARGFNDSFANSGVVKRFGLAIDGFHRLGSSFFGSDSEEAHHVRRIICNEFTLRMFLYAKKKCRENPALESKQLLNQLMLKAYCDHTSKNLITKLIYFAFPAWLYDPISNMLKLTKKFLNLLNIKFNY